MSSQEAFHILNYVTEQVPEGSHIVIVIVLPGEQPLVISNTAQAYIDNDK